MENLLIEAVKIVNPVQLALIALIGFYYYNRTDDKIKEVRTDIKSDINNLQKQIEEIRTETKSINSRIDKLYDLILDLYKTLSKRDAA